MELSDIIGVSPDASRYRTVIERWKGYLQSVRNQTLGRDRLVGFRILKPWERIDFGDRKIYNAAKRIRKAGSIVASTPTDELDEVQRKKQE